MASGSRVCPNCGKLNSVEDSSCFYCKKRFPGPVQASLGGFWGDFSADGAPGTKLVALICLVVYALLMVSDGPFRLELSVAGSFKLSSLLRFGVLFADLVYAEPWRLLSAVFLHLGLFHIAMNLFGLVGLGREVERRYGTARFLVLFTITGVLGFAVSQWWYERLYGSSPPTAGASGALFGLLGAEIGRMWGTRDPAWKRQLVNYLLGALIWHFAMPAMNTAAHLGGFFVGVLLARLFEWEKRPELRAVPLRILAAICVLASVGSLVLSARSPVWKQARALEIARGEEVQP
ncbi:MAG: rhomboid family intramembrane serine protease [Myxococcales bacterium]|nr:MAG: rhomboid family intramembrane serine protease [Myxococcales bacterium]